jgi:hypothetical protein
VAARIPLAGLDSHRAGAVHLTAPPWAGAADDSASFGADAQAEKIARVESEIIETQLKIRDLFKFVCLLVNLQAWSREA